MADSPSVPPKEPKWNGMTGRQLLMLCSDHENAIEQLRAENFRLTEALERVTNFGKSVPDAVQLIARAALGSVSSEQPREKQRNVLDREWLIVEV